MPSTPGITLFGKSHRIEAGSPSTSSLNASGLKVAGLYIAPKAGSITDVYAQVNSKTGTPPTYEVRVETLTAGVPSGTLAGTGANADIVIPGTLPGGVWTTLGTPLTVSKGDALAAVVGYRTGTINGSNFAAFGYAMNVRQIMPSAATYNGTTWTGAGLAAPIPCLRYSDGTIIPGGWPVTTRAATSFNSGSTPNERATFFTPSVSVTVGEVLVALRFVATGSTATITLYDSASNVLDSVNVDGSIAANTTTLTENWIRFADTVLTAGSLYGIGIKATHASNNVMTQSVDFFSTAERDFVFGSGYRRTRTGAGSWTDTTTGVEWVTPVVSAVAAGSGVSRSRTFGGVG